MSRAENLTHECEDNVTNWHNKNRKRAFDRFHTSLLQYVLIRIRKKDFFTHNLNKISRKFCKISKHTLPYFYKIL